MSNMKSQMIIELRGFSFLTRVDAIEHVITTDEALAAVFENQMDIKS